MDRKDLCVLLGISCFAGVFFYINCFCRTGFDLLIATVGCIGIMVIPMLIGMFFYNKEVKVDG